MSTNDPVMRLAYSGEESRLVIAIDVGTTFSGASYTILQPNQVPKIYSVSRYEGQEDVSGSTKVPSVLYYGPNGQLIARGPAANEHPELDNGTRVEWFKLLFRPPTLNLALEDAPLTLLPPGKSVLDVLADFLDYMHSCVKKDVSDIFIDGPQLWNSLIATATFVLTHPNGWEGDQQSQMREAAVRAGLVPDTQDGRRRVEFVTEGEASFHWCVDMGWAAAAMSLGSRIVIADAGGGTIDVSSFRVTSTRPLKLEETSIASCEVSGSVFVTQRFKNSLSALLEGSRYGDEEHIDELTETFDKTTKRLFRTSDKVTYMKIGGKKTNEPQFAIRGGQLSIQGDMIASAFEPSCIAAAKAISEAVGRHSNSHVFLTGGFGASPWLQSELRRRLSGKILDLKSGGSDSGRAVAHGAVAYFLDRHVNRRVARHTLGVLVGWRYDPLNPEHVRREADSYVCSITGIKWVQGGFDAIVKKASQGDPVDEGETYKTSVVTHCQLNQRSIEVRSQLLRYNGAIKDIVFKDVDRDMFDEICKVTSYVDTNNIAITSGLGGRRYYEVNYNSVLELGKTELTSFVTWTEKGVSKRGDATIVWTGL